MKALRVPELPSGDWLYEMKFDGYRALAFKAGKDVRLVSRNKIDFGNDHAQLVTAILKRPNICSVIFLFSLF
jgi:bifunctional non-homologous end joining protein LigD